MIRPVAILLPALSSGYSRMASKYSKDSYHRLNEHAEKQNIDLRFVLGEDNYANGTFRNYWKFVGEDLVFYDQPFTAELVYLQTREPGLTFSKQVNNQFLVDTCLDKYKTYQQYPELVKKTRLVTATTSIEDFVTELVVVKPQFGGSGDNVQVIRKQDFKSQNYISEPFIVQELIDSSAGVPGVLTGRHELRLYVFNGQIKASYFRIPAEGSYLSNVAQGAKERQMSLSEIPQSARDLAAKVDAVFTNITPRLYTIDVMYETGKPWIVELNDMPGMPDIEVQPLTDSYLNSMLELFKEAV